MDKIEQSLKIHEQRRSPRRHESGSFCLSDEQIATLAEGKCRGRPLRQILNHLAQCSYCRQEVVELKEAMRVLEPMEVPQHILGAEKTVLENT